MVDSDPDDTPTALIVGASRGLGHAIAAEFAGRGWRVIGTVRDPDARTPLHELAERMPDRVGIERLDITDDGQIAALRRTLGNADGPLDGRPLDLLFVNAGTTADEDVPIGEVPVADFVEVMVTNALSPMRVIQSLHDVVAPAGLIGAMSSGQGSIANTTRPGREVYKGSKAALNMFLRVFAARESESARSFVLMAPGWVQTDLGGSGARFTIEETVPKVVDVLLAKRGRPGLEYLDRFGETVPW